MGWIFRWLATGFLVVAVLILWWFPRPLVYLVEKPDFAYDYESQYREPGMTFGSFGVFQETMRQSRLFAPLSSYILEQMEGRPLLDITESEFHSLALSGEGPRYVTVNHDVFRDVFTSPGFLRLRDDRGIFLLRYRLVNAADYGRHQLSDELRYPLRSYSLWIVALSFASFLLLNRISVDTRISGSSIGPTVAVIALLLALSVGLISWPFLHGMLDSDRSYASIFIGAFLFLSLGIALLMLRPFITMIEGFFSNKGVLAHWLFTPKEWQPIRRERFHRKQRSQNIVWFLVAALAVGFTGYMAANHTSSLSLMALGGALVLVLVWRLLLQMAWKQQIDLEGEQEAHIFVGLEGLYCVGEVHRWRGIFSRFVSADVEHGDSSQLLVRYATLGAHSMGGRGIPRVYWNHYSVDVPIPRGKEGEAQALALQLNELHGISKTLSR